MKKGILLFSVLLLVIYSGMVLGSVTSINYPAPNDIISETARVQLNVTSTVLSTNCIFNYDQIKNVSVNCNGISLVNLPNGDDTYNITVCDNASSCVTQQVTVRRDASNVSVMIYLLAIFLLLGCVFDVFHLLSKFISLNINAYDMGVTYSLVFGLMVTYQLALEYLKMPFLMTWLDICIASTFWILIVGGTTGFAVSMIYQWTRKEPPKGPPASFGGRGGWDY